MLVARDGPVLLNAVPYIIRHCGSNVTKPFEWFVIANNAYGRVRFV